MVLASWQLLAVAPDGFDLIGKEGASALYVLCRAPVLAREGLGQVRCEGHGVSFAHLRCGVVMATAMVAGQPRFPLQVDRYASAA